MAGVAAAGYLTIDSVVRGHHILYIRRYGPGEERQLEQESGNAYDQYAIAVMKDRLLVSRVPRNFLKFFGSF